jgi:hypothetical protein
MNRRSFLRRSLALLCAAPLASLAGLTHTPRPKRADYYAGWRIVYPIGGGRKQVRTITGYSRTSRATTVTLSGEHQLRDTDTYQILPSA